MSALVADLAAAIGRKIPIATGGDDIDDGGQIDLIVILYACNETTETVSSISRGNYTHAITLTKSARYGSRALEFTPCGFGLDTSCEHRQVKPSIYKCNHPMFGPMTGKELYRAKKSPAYVSSLIARCQDGDEWSAKNYSSVSSGNKFNCLTFAEWTVEMDLEPRALARLVKNEDDHVVHPHPPSTLLPMKLEHEPGTNKRVVFNATYISIIILLYLTWSLCFLCDIRSSCCWARRGEYLSF